ncbi:MAG: CbtA family protein, partial [SAR324 cluster bacterium]|nr:CbtA family protein [SAR324 cluster bacterium]
MISRAFTTVLLTGFVAGIFSTGAQMLKVTPLILESEKYEIGETDVPHSHESSAVSHEHGLNGVSLEAHKKMGTPHETQPAAHDHDGVVHYHSSESWAPGDGAERTFYTAVSNIVTAIAFSLMLVAVFLLRGKSV